MPKKQFTEVINFRITSNMKELLEAESQLRNISMADLIRYKLSEALINADIVKLLGQGLNQGVRGKTF